MPLRMFGCIVADIGARDSFTPPHHTCHSRTGSSTPLRFASPAAGPAAVRSFAEGVDGEGQS